MKIIDLQNKIIHIIHGTQSIEIKLQEICDFLRGEISHFDWVGFYFRNGKKER